MVGWICQILSVHTYTTLHRLCMYSTVGYFFLELETLGVLKCDQRV